MEGQFKVDNSRLEHFKIMALGLGLTLTVGVKFLVNERLWQGNPLEISYS